MPIPTAIKRGYSCPDSLNFLRIDTTKPPNSAKVPKPPTRSPKRPIADVQGVSQTALKVPRTDNSTSSSCAVISQEGLSSIPIGLQTMHKNALKAIREHHLAGLDSYADESCIPPIEYFQRKMESPTKTPLFSYEQENCLRQGIRDSMDDFVFYKVVGNSILTGVFDGHGGPNVALNLKLGFYLYFYEAMEVLNDAREAFIATAKRLQEDIIKNKNFKLSGSTAVICYIDKLTNLIYTATIGECEANIYRKIGNETLSIPLSCTRNWNSESDAKRAEEALIELRRKVDDLHQKAKEKEAREAQERGEENHLGLLPQAQEKKETHRINYSFIFGISASRAFGDEGYNSPDQKAIIPKPVISINCLEKGDQLILASDGLKKFCSEREIINQIKGKNTGIAKNLVEFALNQKHSKDNVSVISIAVT